MGDQLLRTDTPPLLFRMENLPHENSPENREDRDLPPLLNHQREDQLLRTDTPPLLFRMETLPQGNSPNILMSEGETSQQRLIGTQRSFRFEPTRRARSVATSNRVRLPAADNYGLI